MADAFKAAHERALKTAAEFSTLKFQISGYLNSMELSGFKLVGRDEYESVTERQINAVLRSAFDAAPTLAQRLGGSDG